MATNCGILLIAICAVAVASAVTNWGRVFHTGLIKQADAAAELIIITPGPDTNVTVTGVLSGNTISHTVTVTRNEPVVIQIPPAYLETATTGSDWKTELKGLKIVAVSSDIGVRLVTRSTANKGSGAITVLPDTTLGQEYRLGSGSTSSMSGPDQFLILATESTTTVTLTWNDYSITGLMVNGVSARSGDHSVVLQEGEALHAMCSISSTIYHRCSKILVTSTKSIAVIAGKEDQKLWPTDTYEIQKGHTLVQNIPSKYAGTEVAFYGYTTLNNMLAVMVFQPLTSVVGETPVSCSYASGDGSLDCSDITNWIVTRPNNTAVKASKPILFYGSFLGTGPTKPSTFYIPTFNQFSTRHIIYLEEGYQYQIIVTGSSIAGISVHVEDTITIKFTGLTLCQDPHYAARVEPVVKAEATSIQYEVYTNYGDFVVEDKDSSKTERGVVEFLAAELNKPFLVIVSEIDTASGNAASTAVAFGIKYVLTYDASTCTKTTTVADDGIDNDCDDRVDEELANGIDDDGDGEVDEDLAPTVDFRVTCLIYDVENAKRTPPTCSIAVNDVVTYTCNTGYSHVGDLTRTCNAGNILTGTQPTCVYDASEEGKSSIEELWCWSAETLKGGTTNLSKRPVVTKVTGLFMLCLCLVQLDSASGHVCGSHPMVELRSWAESREIIPPDVSMSEDDLRETLRSRLPNLNLQGLDQSIKNHLDCLRLYYHRGYKRLAPSNLDTPPTRNQAPMTPDDPRIQGQRFSPAAYSRQWHVPLPFRINPFIIRRR